MPDYCFYTHGKQIVVLERSEVNRAIDLMVQGYKKEVEEVHAINEKQATARFADIRK